MLLKAGLAAAGQCSWGEVVFDAVTMGIPGGGKALQFGAKAMKQAAGSAALKSAGAINKLGSEKLAKDFYRSVTRGREVCFKLEPVDMATGNMVDFQTDVFIDGTLPLVVDRNANTNHQFGRALGTRWVTTMDVRIEICDGEILMLSPDGALLTFPPAPEDGSEVRADGRPWLLSYSDGAYYVRNIADGLTYIFRLYDLDTDSSGDGEQVGVADQSPSIGGSYVAASVPSGSLAETLELGIEIGISSIIHRTGASIDYQWNVATGQMVRMRRSDGTILDIEWDAAVDKVANVHVSNPVTHPDQEPQRLISYEYDPFGQLVRVVNSGEGALTYHYDDAGRIYAWTDRNGVSYFYRFDDEGRVHSQVGTGGMFPNIVYWAQDTGTDAPEGGTVCVAIETAGEFRGDPLELGDSVIPDYFDRLEQLPLYRALVEGGLDGAGLTGRGRTAERDEDSWTVPEEWLHDELLGDIRPTVYRSTPAGDVWRIVTPEGRAEDTTHNHYHQKTSVTDPAGATVQYSYNIDGIQTVTTYPDGSTLSIEPASWGAPARIVDAYGQATECRVDAFGMIESITTASGATTSYTHDIRATGIVQASITYPDGTSTQIERDNAGRAVATTDAAGRRTSLSRDVRGLITQSMDPIGLTSTVEYTPEGWPTAVTHPDGTTVNATYDGEGNQLSLTNEIGAIRTTAYTVFDAPVATTDASGATTRLTYNTQMEPIRLSNADDNYWTYSYDLDGRLTKQVDYNGIPTTTARSQDGLTMSLTTPAGTTTRTRHADGRLANITDGLGTTSYVYDELGRLNQIVGPQASIEYNRDDYGRVTAETVRLISGETSSYHLDIDHSDNRRSESVSLPLGDRITTHFGRDAAGEISSTTHTYRAIQSESPNEVARLTYGTDQRGYRNKITAEALVRTIVPDEMGRVSSDTLNVLESTSPGGMRTVSSRMFEWRADNALHSVTDFLRGVSTYDLDVLGRATGVTRNDGASLDETVEEPDQTSVLSGSNSSELVQTEKYSFSAAGMLTGLQTSESDCTSFTPGGSTRTRSSLSEGSIEFAGTLPTRVGRTSYKYDEAGRVVQTVTKRISKKPLVHNFFYATNEQPIGFTSSDEPGIGYRYLYDPNGRRVAKERVNTGTGEVLTRTMYVHAGNHLVGEQITLSTDFGVEHGIPSESRPAVGDGHVWTTDPATGELTGQITLSPRTDAEPNCGATKTPKPGTSVPRLDLIMPDLAGSPMEIVDVETGAIRGVASQTLYGMRTWKGQDQSPLLYAGQYLDEESGWAYNRYRYYHPHAGIYNAQDPLGVAPNIASTQGYVDHPAHWIDYLGLNGKSAHEKAETLADNVVNGKDGEAKIRAILNEHVVQGPNGRQNFDEQMTVKVRKVIDDEVHEFTSRIDFIAVVDGRLEFFEVKTGNATLSKNQVEVQKALSDNGTVELRANISKAKEIGRRQGSMVTLSLIHI